MSSEAILSKLDEVCGDDQVLRDCLRDLFLEELDRSASSPYKDPYRQIVERYADLWAEDSGEAR